VTFFGDTIFIVRMEKNSRIQDVNFIHFSVLQNKQSNSRNMFFSAEKKCKFQQLVFFPRQAVLTCNKYELKQQDNS